MRVAFLVPRWDGLSHQCRAVSGWAQWLSGRGIKVKVWTHCLEAMGASQVVPGEYPARSREYGFLPDLCVTTGDATVPWLRFRREMGIRTQTAVYLHDLASWAWVQEAKLLGDVRCWFTPSCHFLWGDLHEVERALHVQVMQPGFVAQDWLSWVPRNGRGKVAYADESHRTLQALRDKYAQALCVVAIGTPYWHRGIAEAQAAGTPVIAEDSPQTRDVGGEGAIYVRDQTEMQAAIDRLRADEAEWKRLSEVGRMVAYHWDPAACFRPLLDLAHAAAEGA